MTPPGRLTHDDVERLRHERGRSTLLFITDRCPVGCGHCSVDSRADSPTITDWKLFGEIVDWLCADPGLSVVGISGGEPFVERRGLSLASARLAAAGKGQVLYTSGVWARRATTPAWIRQVLERCNCVYLSTDGFHARAVPDADYVRAARAIANAGSWIVVQVLDLGEMVEQATALLREAFGVRFEDFAELRPIRPLSHGRGATVFERSGAHLAHSFGPCPLVATPIVRYDGRVTACCNESVIMGHGPARLRRQAATGAQVDAAVQGFHDDPLLRAVGSAGLGPLTAHPRYRDLADREFADQCQLCWTMLDRSPPRPEPDRLLDQINVVAEVVG